MSSAGTANPLQVKSAAPGAPPWWFSLGAGLLFTVTMILAFPPFSLWGLVFVAPAGLFYLGLNAGPRPNRAAWLAAAGVVPFWLVQMRYINDITTAGYVPLAIWFSVFTWLFVWTLARCKRALPRLPSALFVAVLWTAVDAFRGDVQFSGFPWYYLAHPLIDVPWLVRPATSVGAYGLTVLVAAVVAAVVLLARPGSEPRRNSMITLVAAAVVWAALSWPSWTPDPARTISVGIVQTNLPQSNKMGWSFEQRLLDMQRFEELTQAAAKVRTPDGAVTKPDVILWPETMFPGFWLDPQAIAAQKRANLYVTVDRPGGPEKIPTTIFADRLLSLQAQLGVPMVVGGIGTEGFRLTTDDEGRVQPGQDAKYNSAFLITGARVQPRYDKIALTPFGEEMPGVKHWPWLQRKVLVLAAQGMAFDLSPGRVPVTLDVPAGDGSGPLRMATPICFEITRGQFCRDLVYGPSGRRADLFANITNDGWFASSDAGRMQHLQLARWRCLETGTPMARSANTGISAVIDERGRVLARGVEGHTQDTNLDGVLTYTLRLSTLPTFFARHGDLVRWPVLAVAGGTVTGALAVAFAHCRRQRKRSST